MPWPVSDAWNQHLDEMNKRPRSPSLSVSLVRIEPPFEKGWRHVAHLHPYWQMEIVENAGFSLDFGSRRVSPKSGDVLLIPPGTWHHFLHPKGKGGWSLKFAVAEMEERYPAGSLPKGPASDALRKALLKLAKFFAKGPDETLKAALESLLAGAVALYSSGGGWTPDDDGALRDLRRMAEESFAACKPLSVSEAASRHGCSTAYLNRVFRKRLGIPAKAYLDQLRFETARRLLLDSGMNVSQVSAEMGFPDVFAFSRFFKRMSGASPRKYKQAQ